MAVYQKISTIVINGVEYDIIPKSVPVGEDESSASLNIGDGSGYVLVEFKDGHIRTKEFDSRRQEQVKYRTNDVNLLVDADNKILEKIDKNGKKTYYVDLQFNGTLYDRNGNAFDPTTSKRSVRILFVGNSFARDSMSYLPPVLKSLQPNLDFVVGNAFIGSSSLGNWLACLSNEDVEFAGSTCSPQTCSYSKFRSSDTSWQSQSKNLIRDILADEEWDIVVYQQVSTYADNTDWDTYFAPYIYDIHNLTSYYAGKNVKFGWVMTHLNTLDADGTRTARLITNARKILSDTATEIIFPYGIAIQNLRTTPLKNLGDNGLLSPDSHHLNEGVGCLSAAYSYALVILNHVGFGNTSVMGDTILPTAEWCQSINVLQPNPSDYSVMLGVDRNSCYTGQAAAVFAVKNPFEVTDCNDYYINTQN